MFPPAEPELLDQVRLSLDHNSLLFNIHAPEWNEYGQIYRLSLDGKELEHHDVLGAHTNFQELPDGTIATLALEYGEVEVNGDTCPLRNDTIVEIAPDGQQTVVWRGHDAFPPEDFLILPSLFEALCNNIDEDNPAVEDWLHVNSLHYIEDTDDYVITIERFNGIVLIDRQTSLVEWILLNPSSNIENIMVSNFSSDSEDLLSRPHSVQALDENTLLVLNRGVAEESDCSEVLEITLDGDEAQRTWLYTSDPCVSVTFFGEAQRLSNGNTAVIWSSAGQLDEITPDGESVWRVNLDIGGAFGFGERIEGSLSTIQ